MSRSSILAALLALLLLAPSAYAGNRHTAPLKKNPNTQKTINGVLASMRAGHPGATDVGVYYVNFRKWEGNVGFYAIGRSPDVQVKTCKKRKHWLDDSCKTHTEQRWWRYTEGGKLIVAGNGTVAYIPDGNSVYTDGYKSRASAGNGLTFDEIGGGTFLVPFDPKPRG